MKNLMGNNNYKNNDNININICNEAGFTTARPTDAYSICTTNEERRNYLINRINN